MAKIYLSSTYEDLVEYRRAASEALMQMQQHVVSMETYAASDSRPLDRCLEDVTGCDVYAGIIAWRYGFIPEGQKKAITELEYEQAGRSGLPRLLFLAAEDAPWPPNLMDADPESIRKLRARLQLDHIVTFFRSPEDLARAVGIAVANLSEERRAGTGTDGAAAGTTGGDADFLRRSVGRIANELASGIRFYGRVSLSVFSLGIVLLLAGALTGNLLLGIGAMLIIGIAVFPLITMASTRRRKEILDGYEAALASATPTPDTLELVHRFLTRQLAA